MVNTNKFENEKQVFWKCNKVKLYEILHTFGFKNIDGEMYFSCNLNIC